MDMEKGPDGIRRPLGTSRAALDRSGRKRLSIESVVNEIVDPLPSPEDATIAKIDAEKESKQLAELHDFDGISPEERWRRAQESEE